MGAVAAAEDGADTAGDAAGRRASFPVGAAGRGDPAAHPIARGVARATVGGRTGGRPGRDPRPARARAVAGDGAAANDVAIEGGLLPR